MAAVNSVLNIAVQATSETYKDLYSGHKPIH